MPEQRILEVWKESWTTVRHFDTLYWQTIRHFTTLLSVLAGGAGAALSIIVIPLTVRLLISAALFSLGAIFGFLGWYVVKRQGLYIGYYQKSAAIAELELVRTLGLPDDQLTRWLENRRFDREFERDPRKPGAVRVVVPWSFFVIGLMYVLGFGVVSVAAAVLAVLDSLSAS